MRERINRLAKGIIDSEVPKIKVTPTGIGDVVKSGGAIRRELVVTSENNLHIKGLVYSSNYRVKLMSGAFGGTYNHIVYEINTGYLEDGDIIKGAFYLVTNGGEREVPYSFRVELSTSGKALSDLKTAEDFAKVAENDMDTALRLFEYRDFIEAPFMKDLHVRAVYDGLKGRPDRRKELEEFLTGLGVKKPVTLSAEPEEVTFIDIDSVAEDTILVRRNVWGYVSLEVTADSDFIEIPKRMIDENDFDGDECTIIFRLHPARMHQGRNFGMISITGIEEQFKIPVSATLNSQGGISAEDSYTKEALARFTHLRLDEEEGSYETALLYNRMLQAIGEMEQMKGDLIGIKLLRADIYLKAGSTNQAAALLDQCKDQVQAERQEKLEPYCYYQYLRLKLQPDEYRKESLIRLLRKYSEENPTMYGLFFLLLKLDKRLLENPVAMITILKHQYDMGCRSPFLYSEGCRVYNSAPELLRTVEGIDLQILTYGAKRELVNKKLALAAAWVTLANKRLRHLHYRLMVNLYRKHPEKEILEAICSILIRSERRDEEAFTWYEKGIKAGISLTRLYEYYLYSLPKNHGSVLPREVLLYFSYGGNELDRQSKSILYRNVLEYLDRTGSLYQEYERAIEKFATEQLFQSQINSNLAVIYDHMLYRDVIDVPMAKVLPSILRSYRVECSNPKMKYVIVRYEEKLDEEAFLLEEGVAYVPLFSENRILLFQDSYGNRYTNTPYVKTQVMNKPELEKRCFELYSDHSMLRLQACSQVMKRGIADVEEVKILEDTLEDPGIHPLYQRLLLSRIIEFYQKQTAAEGVEDGGSYLVKLDKRVLTKEERLSICETLIHNSYMEEAFDMIREFGCEGIRTKRLLKLCTKMILKNLFDQDSLLLLLSYKVFEENTYDSIVLDYLCEHYNGLSDQMYRVLLQGITEHVETYDLEERLVAQMMFSGCTDTIDKVFDLYMSRKNPADNIMKAYFTIKSTEYFMKDQTPDDKVFSYLEGAVNSTTQIDRIPTIYLLALTKYYSELKSLTEDQQRLCHDTVSLLLESGLVFPYYKVLSRYMPMPEDIMDKAMIQYSAERDSRIELQIRILPDEEEFHIEDMHRMYQGVFVKQKILFEGEIMEYRISEQEGESWVLKQEGSVSCDTVTSSSSPNSRFSCLNEMGLCLSIKDEEGLKKRMQEYLKKNAAAEQLFLLM